MAEVEERGYRERQSVRDGEYERQYREWLASLTPEERNQLNELEVGKPLIYHAKAGATWQPLKEGFHDSTAEVGQRLFGGTDPHPWHPVDLLEPLEEQPLPFDHEDLARLGAYDAEMLQTLLRVLLFPDDGRCNLRAGWMRLVALAHALHVPGIGEKSLEQLAQQMGATRSLLCHYVTALRDYAKLDHIAGKSLEAREIYARARTVDWNRRQRESRERAAQRKPLLASDA